MPRLLLLVLNMSLLASPTFAARLPEIPIGKDLVYATVGGVELKYDWAKPPAGDGPFPFVLCIHAGGWQLGDKRSFRDDLQALAGRGYVAATVNYRLMPKYRWPAQLEDARAAVRYFRSRASDLKIDPARFGAVGDDAGAHLALMLGLLGVKEEKDKPVEQSTRVQAIVSIFGPTDLREIRVTGTWVQIKIFAAFGKSLDQVLADFLGTADRAAPIYYEASDRKSTRLNSSHTT
jgi:acetyl esterase/lipase